MDIRHKRKALIGLALWVGAVPVAILAGFVGIAASHSATNQSAGGVCFLVFILVQYAAFFWGGSHLARAKGYSNGLIIVGIFWPAQILILGLLLFGLPDKCPSRTRSERHRKHREPESQIGRVVRYRRNAFVANVFGVAGIVIALALYFLPLGLFEHRDNAHVAAMFVFLPGYAAVIYGCGWWVRAKNWPDAVILIGLLPLAVLLIPYVRLLYLVAPLLLPAGMVLMPVLLLGVIAVLPDKSGLPKRKRWDED